MPRILLPREHGTYAQLTFPLLSGLLLGGLTAAGSALALSAVTVFLCYEPVAVLLGVRGARLQREQARAARGQLALLLPVAVLLGVAGLLLAPPSARLVALVPAGLGMLLLPLVPLRRVKSLAGETLVAGALASLHLPLAAAGGAAGVPLWAPAGVWFTGFFGATLAVHAIKARQKQRSAWLQPLAAVLPLLGIAGAAAVLIFAPALRLVAAALAVPLLAVLAVHAARVHPRALKRVGWTIVAADTATLVLLGLLRP